jgi:cytochrome P450/NADPH-cytochrome P450 reductase
MKEALIFLAKILQKYEVTLVGPTENVNPIEKLTLRPDHLKITLKKRTIPEGILNSAKKQEDNLKGSSLGDSSSSFGKIYNKPQPVVVLYGTHLFTTKERAEELALVSGFSVQHLAPLNEFASEKSWEKLKGPNAPLVAIVTCTINGDPPATATEFVKWLNSLQNKQFFQGVNFTIFGCGNKDYSGFQRIPRLVAKKLEEFGGKPIVPLAEGDSNADLPEAFTKWRKQVANFYNVDPKLNPKSNVIFHFEIFNRFFRSKWFLQMEQTTVNFLLKFLHTKE